MRIIKIVLWILCICCVTCMILPGALSGTQDNTIAYTQQYADAIAQFSKAGMQRDEFVENIKRLKELGFYAPSSVSKNPYMSSYVKAALRLFYQCAGIPTGDEIVFTPLARALLQDKSFVVTPGFPMLRTHIYFPSDDVNDRVQHSDKQFSRLKRNDYCSIEGVVVDTSDWTNIDVDLVVKSSEGAQYRMTYRYPERSTRFIVGDRVLVLGVVDGNSGENRQIAPDFIGLK